MKKSFVAAALLAGLVGPASAATVIDFTANDDRDGTTIFGVDWNVTNGTTGTTVGLSDARHSNPDDCGIYTCFDFGVGAAPNRYDVGFGIRGANNEEIDPGESVVVTFMSRVTILGFAGMLAYFDSKGTETVRFEYSKDGGLTWLGELLAPALENDNGNSFDTVGLTSLDNLRITANAVRFTATGAGLGDDGSFNVTAAALTVAPVPVPASLPLLLAGIGALGFAARRKRKSA